MSTIHDLATICASQKLWFHVAHLNVTGPQFGPLHKQYGDIYEMFDGWFDKFAERARACGERFDPSDIEVGGPIKSGDFLQLATGKLKDITKECEPTLKDLSDDLVSQNMAMGFFEDVAKQQWMLNSST